MKRLVVVLSLLGALWATPAAHASIPTPWCGTDVVSIDRIPDATFGFAAHVIYVHPPGSPDRFVEWAPRIAGDVTAIDAWWRTQDPTRAPRFDLFGFPCSSIFGAVDISRVAIPNAIGSPEGPAFDNLRSMLETSFNASEKVYLVYYDGPTNQPGPSHVCGQGAEAGNGSVPGLAVVYLDSCGAEATDSLRPVVAVHELAHVFGAVATGAPHRCNSGHVCDFPNDLLAATLLGTELETLVLDGGRDDYYGHAGRWLDLQDSIFLERLDSPDRAAPSTPAGLNVKGPATGSTRFSWSPATDDVGPVSYRVTQDNRFVDTVRTTSTGVSVSGSALTKLSIRAVDAVGHLSPPREIFFKGGLGVVDARGRLLRDTVQPPAPGAVTVIRLTKRAAAVSWRDVRDAGGLRGYRIRLGSRTIIVKRPAMTLDTSKLHGPVTIAAVDRAGNVGPIRTIPLSRFR